MIQVLQEVVLVLLITLLTGVQYEKIQDVPRGKSPQFQQACVEDAQVQPEPEPDAGRYSPLIGAMLPSAGSPP